MAHKANGHNYQFYGVGLEKDPRRSNGPRPRKQYAYETEEQKGTPMGRMIRKDYARINKLINAMNPEGPGTLEIGQVKGALGRKWKNIARSMTNPAKAAEYAEENRMTGRQAMNELIGICSGIKFGADPSSR